MTQGAASDEKGSLNGSTPEEFVPGKRACNDVRYSPNLLLKHGLG